MHNSCFYYGKEYINHILSLRCKICKHYIGVVWCFKDGTRWAGSPYFPEHDIFHHFVIEHPFEASIMGNMDK